MGSSLESLNSEVVTCEWCARLVDFRSQVAREKRKQYKDWTYWGKPVPGYGDTHARLLIVGLAPAAHGGNRTGRVFTGDKSAEFLMRCLYDAGLANQPDSLSRDDGLILHDGYMTPVLKCVPPGDKPTAMELRNCFSFLSKELEILNQVTVVLALGKIAFDSCLTYFRNQMNIRKKDYPFGHAVQYELPNGLILTGSYHPSPRNVNTRRLNYLMMNELLDNVKGVL